MIKICEPEEHVVKIESLTKVEFKNTLPSTLNYNNISNESWNTFIMSQGDIIECAHTYNLWFVSNSEINAILDKRSGSSIRNYTIEYDRNDDYDEDQPNTKFMFLGKQIFLLYSGNQGKLSPFLKMLDVQKNTIKWFDQESLGVKISRGFVKKFTLLERLTK